MTHQSKNVAGPLAVMFPEGYQSAVLQAEHLALATLNGSEGERETALYMGVLEPENLSALSSL